MKHLTLVKKLLLIVLLGVLGICGILWIHRFPAANKPALHTAAPPASMVGPNTNAITNNALKAASANSNVSVSRPLNPYASALREPGKSKRAWDAGFIEHFAQANKGDPIRFELTEGVMAEGVVGIIQLTDGRVTYISGELTAPEPGKYF